MVYLIPSSRSERWGRANLVSLCEVWLVDRQKHSRVAVDHLDIFLGVASMGFLRKTPRCNPSRCRKYGFSEKNPQMQLCDIMKVSVLPHNCQL